MIPLTRRDIGSPPCSTPGCDHKDHDQRFIHARCHIYAPVKCTLEGDVLYVRCSLCENLVAPFRVELDEPLSIENTCHPNATMDCVYDNGALHLVCQRCDTRVVTLPVAEGSS
jgi:hypothetical protein